MEYVIPPPSSGGIILSYQCSNRCRHCLYACSPKWADWMTSDMMETVFQQLSNHNQFLTGIHIGGGEPLLNPDLVVETIKKAVEYQIPIDYVETNAFWSWGDEKTESIYCKLKEAGLNRILVSVSPFHLEYIPMDRVNRAVRVARNVFGVQNTIVYTQYFFDQFQELDPTHPLPLEDYLAATGNERAALAFATEYALVANGRAATQLNALYQNVPAEHFFGSTCEKELLSPHHIHIDLYGNYIVGLCAGISLGKATHLDALIREINTRERPIVAKLLEGGVQALFKYAAEDYGYKTRPEGYMAKCHLCLDIRRHLKRQSTPWIELVPELFYQDLDEPARDQPLVSES